MIDRALDRILFDECVAECPLNGTTKPMKPNNPGHLFNGIMLIGEAPGAEEERLGKPFCGDAGILLRKVLKKEANIQMDYCYVSNVLLCRPPGNRNPMALEIKACAPTLITKIKEINPTVIVAIGNFALKTLTGKTGITRLSGTLLTTKKSTGIDMVEGYPVIPIIHPAAVLRNSRNMGEFAVGIQSIKRYMEGTLIQPKDIGSYRAITNIDEAILFLNNVKDVIAVDVETDSLDWADRGSVLKTIGMSIKEKEAVAIDFRKWTARDLGEILQSLGGILKSRKILKVLHNATFDMNFLYNKFGLEVKPPIFDTKVAQFLCNELLANDLKSMAWKYTKLGGFEKNYSTDRVDQLEGDELIDYNCHDADITFRCYQSLEKELKVEKVNKVFNDLLMPVQFPLAEMERHGIRIDIKKFDWLERTCTTVFDAIKGEMESHPAVKSFKKRSKKFNPSSTLHLRDVVFQELGMPIIKSTQTGAPSVDRESMDTLAGRDPLIDLIIEYKEVQKIKSTYIEGLKKKIRDGRIHTRYLSTVARSGRTASSGPNLQNLPIAKEGSVMEKYGLHVKEMFIPDPMCMFLEPDYNQHELRVMCIVSLDSIMKHIFDNGLDIHHETAKEIFRTNVISPTMRRETKTVVFGILYGMGYYKLSKQLGIPPDQAREYIRRFFSKYWGVKKWQRETELFVRQHGYIETLTGRRRRFPSVDGILSDNDIRAALNTPIQGLASDFLMYSLIGIHKMFKYYKLKSSLCAQIHDSILINVYAGEESQVMDICTNVMVHPPVDFDLYTSLAVDWKKGDSWANLKDV